MGEGDGFGDGDGLGGLCGWRWAWVGGGDGFATNTPNSILAGTLAQTPLGKLTVLPRTHSWI